MKSSVLQYNMTMKDKDTDYIDDKNTGNGNSGKVKVGPTGPIVR